MQIEWDPKVGPATVAALGGTLVVIVSIGVMWGTVTTKLDTVIEGWKKSDREIAVTKDTVQKQDDKIASQAERIKGVESTLTVLVPTIQRIEAAISAERPFSNPRPHP